MEDGESGKAKPMTSGTGWQCRSCGKWISVFDAHACETMQGSATDWLIIRQLWRIADALESRLDATMDAELRRFGSIVKDNAYAAGREYTAYDIEKDVAAFLADKKKGGGV